MVDGEKTYRVVNRCIYDIGVQKINGMQMNIRAGSFQVLSANDILYIETTWPNGKYFSTKKLVPVDENGKDVELEEIGMIYEEEASMHMDKQEIEAILRQSIKKISSWIENIDAPDELHFIYDIAKEMDLPMSKIKILKEKMPTKDWMDELAE